MPADGRDRVWVVTLHDPEGSSPIVVCPTLEDAKGFVDEQASRPLHWRPIHERDDRPDDPPSLHGYEATQLGSGRWTVQSCDVMPRGGWPEEARDAR